MPEWIWQPETQSYRDETGHVVTSEQVREWVLESIRKSGDAVTELARLLAEGKLSLDDWRDLMRQEIKDEYLALFLLGLGGLALLRAEDILLLTELLREQFAFLDNFAGEIGEGLVSDAQAMARARMYTSSAWQSYQRGRARAAGAPRLPAYQGDGTTLCLGRCRCTWDLQPVRENGEIVRWNCYWILDPLAEHCSAPGVFDAEGRPLGCLERAVLWNPLIIEVM